MQHNAVMGMVYDCDFRELDVFFKSLERHLTTRCPVVLFTNNMTGPIPDGILCVPFERNPMMHNLCLRFKLYYDFIRSNPRICRKILLTDIRDVVFQQDPFIYPLNKGITVALEDRSKTIGTCPYNSQWVKELLGWIMHDSLSSKPISCAGVTIGDRESILVYLEKMNAFLRGQKNNLDQAAHNAIVHLDLVPSIHKFDNFYGPVLTMGYMDQQDLSATRIDLIPILHQYDRHPELAMKIRGEYK